MFFLISEKNDSLRRILLVSEFNFKDTSVHYRYGDLYRQCLVEDFKESMYWPNRQKENNTPDDADIFLIGDSYFERPIAGEFICTELENLYGYNIYDITGVNSGSANNPLAAIKQLEFGKDKHRILLLETTERFSMDRGLEQYIAASKLTGFRNMSGFFRNDEIKNWLYKIFLNRIFYIEHNYITLPVLSFKNTLNFKLFKMMDNNIGAFSAEPPMLFYSQDVEFARRTKTHEAVDSMVNNIAELNNILKKDYNISLLYIVIPDKYSVYNDYVNGEYKYSGFIPELTKKLTGKGIYTIDLYTAFMDFRKSSPEKILYKKSDSHFNAYGKAIFLEMVNVKIKEIKNKEKL